jgi:hypothetical protein
MWLIGSVAFDLIMIDSYVRATRKFLSSGAEIISKGESGVIEFET